MDLQEVGCVYMEWIGLAQDRGRWRTLVSAIMKLRVPLNVGSFLTSCKPVSFSRRTLHHGVSKVWLNSGHLLVHSYNFGTFQPLQIFLSNFTSYARMSCNVGFNQFEYCCKNKDCVK